MKEDHLPATIKRIIEAATLAPSSHNTQPWKFVADQQVIHIFPDFSRGLPVADPQYREIIISLGCALENLIVAAHHEGFAAKTHIFTRDPDSIAVELKPAAYLMDAEEEAIYTAIGERQTTRRFFDGRLLDAQVEKAIRQVPLEDGVNLRLFTSPADLGRIAALVSEADEYWMDRPTYRRELADWVRFSRQAADSHRDGLTSAASGRSWAPEWLGRLYLRFFAGSMEEAEKDSQLIYSASGIMLFYTTTDDPASWVRLGQSFERVALLLTRLGLKHAHHNQACEAPDMHHKIRQIFGPQVACPQLLVRIGYAEPMPGSPRRQLEEVLT